MDEEEIKKDLLKYYKMVKRCSNPKCNRLFGVDGKGCGNRCPICLSFRTYGQSRLERLEEIQNEQEKNFLSSDTTIQ